MSSAWPVKSQPLDTEITVDAVIAAVGGRSNPAVLDSADAGPQRGRYTIITCDPVETAAGYPGDDDPFEAMRRRINRTTFPASLACEFSGLGPFLGGWIGYFAYEAGRYIEQLPATAANDVYLPIARFALYDTAAVHDALTGQWSLVAVDLPDGRSRTPADERLDQWRHFLESVVPQPLPAAPPLADEPAENMTHADYIAMIRRAKEYIAAGDIFQANLARRLTFETSEPPIALYRRLRRTNPGAYACFLQWPEGSPARTAALLSTSPELFLQLDGRNVLTRPVKGTRPRCDDPIIDCANRMELAASDKDRAELAMIVDLERNDLGRVCEFGSVRVATADDSPASPYILETHPTVHHLVAEVTGRLRDGYDAIDLLRACFPGGSITGAPKVRAMEIIDELEPTERSVYTGSIGYFSLTGQMTMNIAIRTMIAVDDKVYVNSGGGIVADSDPEEEYRETQVKILGLCRALSPSSVERAAIKEASP